MGARGADGLLRALESRLSHVAAMEEPVVMAFSGGIASLLLAAMVRKRVDLECVVVGVRGAPDLRTAAEERLYLDYRVTEVRLSPARALALARGLARRHPEWSVADVLDAVPLEAVRGRHPDVPILAGVIGSPFSRRAASDLPALGFSCPWLPGRPRNRSGRARLVAAAEALGLPSAFVGAPPCRPALGSGIGPALRAVSRKESVSVARLVRP